MTDKEKLEAMLPYSADNFEDIISLYINLYGADFTLSRLHDLTKLIDKFLMVKVHCYELAIDNSLEKASYIKSYLEGKMWKDERSAKANVNSQIKNAESIIDFWHMATGKKCTEVE
jgi:hypothetical protein